MDCFIAASESIRDILAGDGIDAAKTVTVYEGIDIERIQSEPPVNIHAELWLPTHAPIVGAAGAFTAEKGHKHLIDAAALAVREVPDARFVLLGEGELRPALERQIKELHLDKHIFLPGFRADVLGFLRSFDVFVMPSLFEGLGTSLLDAMAASKPTVATETGGIPEVVDNGVTGLLIPPRDHHGMARAIVRLLKDQQLRTHMALVGLAGPHLKRQVTVYRKVKGKQ